GRIEAQFATDENRIASDETKAKPSLGATQSEPISYLDLPSTSGAGLLDMKHVEEDEMAQLCPKAPKSGASTKSFVFRDLSMHSSAGTDVAGDKIDSAMEVGVDPATGSEFYPSQLPEEQEQPPEEGE